MAMLVNLSFVQCIVYLVFFLIEDMVTVTDRHYGVHTNAKQIQAHFVFSDETKENQAAMMAMQRLDCGQGHMGEFWKCTGCEQAKCTRCWMRCKDPVMKGLLSAPTSMLNGREWQNNCKVCKENCPNDKCLHDCLAARNFQSALMVW